MLRLCTGYIGIVKDATLTTARVELHTNCKTISVDISRLGTISSVLWSSVNLDVELLALHLKHSKNDVHCVLLCVSECCKKNLSLLFLIVIFILQFL